MYRSHVACSKNGTSSSSDAKLHVKLKNQSDGSGANVNMVSGQDTMETNGTSTNQNGETNGNNRRNSMGGDFDTNLYSRQLYTFGEKAMRRLRGAQVLISGLGGLGVEIAKNLILSGVRHVTLHDTKLATFDELSSQYYLTEKDIGTNRAKACFQNLAELNDSVTVECNTASLTEQFVAKFDVVVLSGHVLTEQLKINKWTRSVNKKLVIADTFGLFGVIFADFGPEHTIDDATGEETVEIYIEYVDKTTGDVTILENARHNLSDDDFVTFSEVKGMTELNNCAPKKVRVVNNYKFNIGDCSSFSDYIEGGIVKQVKMPVKVAHKSLLDSLEEPEFLISDFAKMERPSQFHIFLQALHSYRDEHNQLPQVHNKDDLNTVFALAEKLNSQTKPKVEKLDQDLFEKFCYGARGNLCPVNSFIGGFAAQEALKAVTGKYTPVKQWFYFDAFECLPDENSPFETLSSEKFRAKGHRYDGQAAVFGWDFQEALGKQNWFVVGAGAIGCELLKNFSMIGLGCSKKSGGSLTVTDMDQIEISNLNRQFLFRRNDVGSKKATVAAQAAVGFNPNLQVTSMCERVGGDTEETFDDIFFSKLNGVANALDNIEARMYMDRRCVYYRKPLLETGTLGPKGNTQVVYPFLTESYSSSQDPPERSIPICTVKHFPNQIEHTIQWGRELFTGLFTNPAETANQFIEDPRQFDERIRNMHTGQKYDMLNTVKKVLIDDRPANIDDCIKWARSLLDESFDWDIQQLLHNFPAEQLTSHGVKFWSGAKRCPHPLVFDAANEEHVQFVLAAAFLRAQMYNLTPSEDFDYVARVAAAVELPPFRPRSGVQIAVNDADLQQQQSEECDSSRLQELSLALAKLKLTSSSRLTPIDFEKDDDSNHHVQFITCASNLRAENYSIQKADCLKTKQIAGRIIPAIATTTAAVAGLACIELYKIVMCGGNCKLDNLKNGFVQFALPFVGFAEPIKAPEKKYYDNKWTLWDRFELKGPLTLGELFAKMEKEHQLKITMLSQGVSILCSFFMDATKREERMKTKIEDIVAQISGKPIPKYVKSLVLEPMCETTDGEDIDVPYIKYDFRF